MNASNDGNRGNERPRCSNKALINVNLEWQRQRQRFSHYELQKKRKKTYRIFFTQEHELHRHCDHSLHLHLRMKWKLPIETTKKIKTNKFQTYLSVLPSICGESEPSGRTRLHSQPNSRSRQVIAYGRGGSGVLATLVCEAVLLLPLEGDDVLLFDDAVAATAASRANRSASHCAFSACVKMAKKKKKAVVQTSTKTRNLIANNNNNNKIIYIETWTRVAS